MRCKRTTRYTTGGKAAKCSFSPGVLDEIYTSMIRTKRRDRTLRFVASEVGGVSASTLSRVEHGNMPDMETFLLVCDWLGASPDDFFMDAPTTPESGRSTFEQIVVLLRMDTTLDTALTDALIVLVQRLIG